MTTDILRAVLQNAVTGFGLASRVMARLAAALAPMLHARVRIRLLILVDGPGNLDPLIEISASGQVSATGVQVDGDPSLHTQLTGGAD